MRNRDDHKNSLRHHTHSEKIPKQRLPDGTWSADVAEQVAALQTYGEVSPSGVGVRFFGLGTLLEKGCKRGNFEIYTHSHYLTVTGHKLDGAPAEILECSPALQGFQTKYVPAKAKAKEVSDFFADAPFASASSRTRVAGLSDEELLGRIANSKKAGKFQALWDGDDSGHKGDASAGDLSLCNKLVYWTGKDAARMDSLFRQSKRMRPKWDQVHYAGGVTYGARTIELAIENCQATYDPSAPQFPSLQADQIPPATPAGEKGTPVYGSWWIAKMLYPHWGVAALDTNMAHAKRLLDYLGVDLRYSSKLGWLHFNGKSWEVDDKDATRTANILGHLSRQVRAEATQLYDLAALLSSAVRPGDAAAMSAAASSHGTHARRVESFKFISDTLQVAGGEVLTDVALFDPKPWVIGFENGVWDGGTWREHRREDFFLNVSPVAVDPAASPDEWNAVLDRMTAGDADLARTLQDVAGYILSGTAGLRLVLWAYGGKGTGKSTFTELLQTLLGKKSTPVSPGKLDRRADRERLGANLWNKVLAVCAEAGNKQIEPDLLKTLSGGDTMVVRFLFNEVFEARPHHVFFLVSNDAPRLDAYDDALKDRILVLPFVHALKTGGQLTLTDGPSILSAREKPNSPLVLGFTNWALEGLARFQQTHAIFRAGVTEAATERFWKDTDPLTEFWESIDVEDLKKGIFASKLRQRFKVWSETVEIGKFNRSDSNFSRACAGIGLKTCRLTKDNARGWRLRDEVVAALKANTAKTGTGAVAGTDSFPVNIYGTRVVTGDVAGSQPDLCSLTPDLMEGVTIESLLNQKAEPAAPQTAKPEIPAGGKAEPETASG